MQALFAQALLDPGVSVPVFVNAASGRFNVYRNNYLITLRNALRSTFPAVERLVGEEFFAALACAFAERHPPQSPIMARYGDAFPGFIETLPTLTEFPYLADVAHLEYARVQAYHAADAKSFGIDSEAAATAALDHPAMLHPSVRIIASAYPTHSIWQAQVKEGDPVQPDWHSETVLVWRHGSFDLVEATPVDALTLELLGHIATGRNLAALLGDCADQSAATLLITRFLELASAGVLVPTQPTDHGENP
ncbi:DNA-binding domain-containing protein [Erythrobacter sp.]|uniref:HvfC/BufC N-terminal domain-containing protein n=1 Tax=Erythrobacter sp. TaxID=1042 RepID=UPI00311FC4B9